MNFKPFLISALSICLISLNACKKEDPNKLPVDPIVTDVTLLNIESSFFTPTYLKLSTGELSTNPKDFLWDICFQHAQLQINGGSRSTPQRLGNAHGQLLHVPYHLVKDIPNLAGLKQDHSGENFALGYRAGGLSWYYTANNIYFPYTDKTIFLATADGKGYAKIKILSFYRNMPDLSRADYNSLAETQGYYSLQYQYIENINYFN